MTDFLFFAAYVGGGAAFPEPLNAAEEQEWFRSILPNVTGAEGVNAILGRAKAAGKAVSIMVAARAKELGLTFDKDAGGYVDPNPPTEDDSGMDRDDDIPPHEEAV